MSEPNANADAPDPHFLNLVFMFQSAAWQHLGKVKNPMTDKVERDLDQARYAIDTLAMLEAKTKGNRTPDEDKLLDHTLYELRMNFVEEKKKGDAPADASEQPAEADQSDEAPTSSEPSEAPEGDESSGGPGKEA